jgi:hypothetical protein
VVELGSHDKRRAHTGGVGLKKIKIKLKKKKEHRIVRHQWLTLAILATWEAEIRRIPVKANLDK